MKNAIAVFLILLSTTLKAQVKVGQAAPEISLPDSKDSIINLSSLKGKVVLLDFWASWCGPCRASNKGLGKIYDKYKSKGFEIFSVSIDEEKDKWLKAIKQDKIKWLQVNDPGNWEAKTVVDWRLYAIPTSFLIDKNGVLLAMDLEGKDLEKALKGLLED